MKKVLVISYFTKNTFYEKEKRSLIASLKEKKICYEIEAINSLGSWEKNCCYKPKFILEKLKKLKRPLLWIDADAVVLKDLDFFNSLKDCDISLKINESYAKDNPYRAMTGTLFINYTQNAIKILNLWNDLCQFLLKEKRDFELWDQMCLKYVLFDMKQKFCIKNLPEKYCYIFDDPYSNLEAKDIHILHFQASRLKDCLNKEVDLLKSLSPIEQKLFRQKCSFSKIKKDEHSICKTFLNILKKKIKI